MRFTIYNNGCRVESMGFRIYVLRFRNNTEVRRITNMFLKAPFIVIQ